MIRNWLAPLTLTLAMTFMGAPDVSAYSISLDNAVESASTGVTTYDLNYTVEATDVLRIGAVLMDLSATGGGFISFTGSTQVGLTTALGLADSSFCDFALCTISGFDVSGLGALQTVGTKLLGTLQVNWVVGTPAGQLTINQNAGASVIDNAGVNIPNNTVNPLAEVVAAAPEPGTLALLGIGLGALAFVRRRGV